MTAANVASRLSSLVKTASAMGEGRSTTPAVHVWAATFGVREDDQSALFAVTAAAHRNVNRLRRQMAIANPHALADCDAEISKLIDAFTLRRMLEPWHTTRQLLSDRVQLSLTACAAALDGRFDESELSQEQFSYVDSLILDFLNQLRDETLPEHIKSFVIASLEELRSALRRSAILGIDEFNTVADRIVGDIGRALLVPAVRESLLGNLLKKVGIGVASLTAGVALAGGIVQLDQQTFQMLPWGDHTDPTIVHCVVDPSTLIEQGKQLPEGGR